MGSGEKALDSRGQLLNPSEINCPIPSTVFPLEIERAIYDVLVSEGESVGIRLSLTAQFC